MRVTYNDKKHNILIDKQQKILIYSLAKKLKMSQERWDQRSKQQEEELQQCRETYIDKQHKIIIDSSANELKLSQETADKSFRRQ